VLLTVGATVAGFAGLSGVAAGLTQGQPANAASGQNIAIVSASPLVGNTPHITASKPPLAIKDGTLNQPAQPWNVAINDNTDLANTGALYTPTQWVSGDNLSIVISPSDRLWSNAGGPNDVTVGGPGVGDCVAFAAVPTVTAGGGPNANNIAPTFNVALSVYSSDNLTTQGFVWPGGQVFADVLTISFTNSGTSDSQTPYTLKVSNIKYNTCGGSVEGQINAAGAYGAGTLTTTAANFWYAFTSAAVGAPAVSVNANVIVDSNAELLDAIVQGNIPPVSLLPGAINASISDIIIQESRAGAIGPAGLYICWTAIGFAFAPTSTLAMTVTSVPPGGETTMNPTIDITSGANPNPPIGNSLVERIVAPSLNPSKLDLSGIKVNVPAGATSGIYAAAVTINTNHDCSVGGTVVEVPGDQNFKDVTVFAVGGSTINSRIFGSVAEQTAVASLETRFPPQPSDGCLPLNTTPAPDEDDVGSSVVLVNSNAWQDALTASYLAAYLHTGVLLTPGDVLSSYTQTAIRNEGVTNVYLVGGTLVLSTALENFLKGLQQFHCGGGSPRGAVGGIGGNLNVYRIAGTTDLDTSMKVATWVDTGFVNFGTGIDMSGMFKLYNHSGSGIDSGASPTIPVRTAILATNQSFQDAAAAGGLSYFQQMPIILTAPGSLSPQALTALFDLGIQQVFLLGGPVATSDVIVGSLTANGIASLRIGGVDFSDTSVQLAKLEINHQANPFANGHPEGLNWNVGFGGFCGQQSSSHCFTAAVARGDFFSDALTSSVVTGALNGLLNFAGFEGPEPLLLTQSPTGAGPYVTSFFNQAGTPYGIEPTPLSPFTVGSGMFVSSITPFGGPLALADATLQSLLLAISNGGTPGFTFPAP
jgi:putative cell wall-binding protein